MKVSHAGGLLSVNDGGFGRGGGEVCEYVVML